MSSPAATAESGKLLKFSTEINMAAHWEQHTEHLADLLHKYYPDMEVGAFWSQGEHFFAISAGSADAFKTYAGTLTRANLPQTTDLVPIAELENSYITGLFFSNQSLGALFIKTKTEMAQEQLQTLAHVLQTHVSMARQVTQLTSEVEKRTSTDKLTGLWNRMYFNERFREECERLIRSQETGTVALMGLDDLGALSRVIGTDEYHTLLAKVGATLRRAVRQTDWVVYWDGSEILFYFPFTKQEALLEVLNRVANQLLEIHPLLSPTIGMCSTMETSSPRALIQLAARRLELSRKDGRKRMICYASQNEGLQFWQAPEERTK